MEAPSEVSDPGADAALPKIAQGPGPAVHRLLRQSEPLRVEPPVTDPVSSRQAWIKWSLLAADVLLILLGAALLNGVPLVAAFWKEWALAMSALTFGGWLAWLSLSA